LPGVLYKGRREMETLRCKFTFKLINLRKKVVGSVSKCTVNFVKDGIEF